jgi:hypothetical protein
MDSIWPPELIKKSSFLAMVFSVVKRLETRMDRALECLLLRIKIRDPEKTVAEQRGASLAAAARRQFFRVTKLIRRKG